MVVDFLRLIDRPYAGGTSSNFLLQTAAVRYRLRDRATRQPFTLDLLSTVHLAEPAYYSGLQEACTRYDRVLFEVIADGSLAPRDADSGTRRLLQPLQATPAQRELAARHRLVAQMDALTDCMSGPSWAVADLPRDEVLRLERRLGPGSPRALLEPAQQLLSTLAFGPARRRGRRGRTSWLFRLVLCLLPAPEAALLLDDWIASGGAPLTPVLGALARCLAAFDVRAVGHARLRPRASRGRQAGLLLTRWSLGLHRRSGSPSPRRSRRARPRSGVAWLRSSCVLATRRRWTRCSWRRRTAARVSHCSTARLVVVVAS
jgi:hypothetical protein